MMSDYSEGLFKTYFIKIRARRGPVSFANKDRTNGLSAMFKTGSADEFGLDNGMWCEEIHQWKHLIRGCLTADS
jgi:hypothetical protein